MSLPISFWFAVACALECFCLCIWTIGLSVRKAKTLPKLDGWLAAIFASVLFDLGLVAVSAAVRVAFGTTRLTVILLPLSTMMMQSMIWLLVVLLISPPEASCLECMGQRRLTPRGVGIGFALAYFAAAIPFVAVTPQPGFRALETGIPGYCVLILVVILKMLVDRKARVGGFLVLVGYALALCGVVATGVLVLDFNCRTRIIDIPGVGNGVSLVTAGEYPLTGLCPLPFDPSIVYFSFQVPAYFLLAMGGIKLVLASGHRQELGSMDGRTTSNSIGNRSVNRQSAAAAASSARPRSHGGSAVYQKFSLDEEAPLLK